MPVLNDTNRGRVTKMVDMVGLIEKSAETNNATAEEMWDLMQPIVDAIENLLSDDSGDADDESDQPESDVPVINDGEEDRPMNAPELNAERPEGHPAAVPGSTADEVVPNAVPGSQQDARWFSILQAAKEAPLSELSRAMGIYTSRVDDLVRSLE